MAAGDRVRAWRPDVPGIAEVFHASWRDHGYPAHTHDTWTLLIVDAGLIGYQLDGRDHGAARPGVTLLPPHVVHDGHPATAQGFRKRVLYLEGPVVDERLIGPAVDAPFIEDTSLREQVSRLNDALSLREEFEAESRLALVTEVLRWHLRGRPEIRALPEPSGVASRARELLDADPAATVTLAAIARTVGVSPAHLVRSFTRSFGIPPHQYVLGRRLDLARRRLLAGDTVSGAAATAGFYDQAHLTRHFKRLLGVTPARYQRGRPAA